MSVWDLLGGWCSGRCFCTLDTDGLREGLATPPPFRSALDADWVIVRMLLLRWTGDWKLVTLPFRRGEGEWTEASWLVMSLSCSSGLWSSTTSVVCSLAENGLNVTGSGVTPLHQNLTQGTSMNTKEIYFTCSHLEDFLLVLRALLKGFKQNPPRDRQHQIPTHGNAVYSSRYKVYKVFDPRCLNLCPLLVHVNNRNIWIKKGWSLPPTTSYPKHVLSLSLSLYFILVVCVCWESTSVSYFRQSASTHTVHC